jgi:uncharacterized protein with PIN domain
MNQATFRIYAELRDFLDPYEDAVFIEYRFWGEPAIKDAIEALGVPHPEVALILLNGRPVPFSEQITSGDRVSVFPAFRRIELGSTIGLQPAPLATPAFVADIHLGQLSRYLRMVGFSCLYRNDFDDAELAQNSAEQQRILLTRDQELLKRSIVQRGYFLRSDQPKRQLVEVVGRYQLVDRIEPFRLCMECDGVLVRVAKEQVVDQLPSNVRQERQEFRQCSQCQRVYWGGSHVDQMQETIDWLIEQFA